MLTPLVTTSTRLCREADCTLWMQMKLLLDIPNIVKPGDRQRREHSSFDIKKGEILGFCVEDMDTVSKLEPILW